MGYYIETPGQHFNKVETICKAYGAVVVEEPKSFSDVSDDTAIICVVRNQLFEAVGYCYSEREFEEFRDPTDPRFRKWLLMDKKKAEELSGFKR